MDKLEKDQPPADKREPTIVQELARKQAETVLGKPATATDPEKVKAAQEQPPDPTAGMTAEQIAEVRKQMLDDDRLDPQRTGNYVMQSQGHLPAAHYMPPQPQPQTVMASESVLMSQGTIPAGYKVKAPPAKHENATRSHEPKK